ncbi:conserved hypothetical integral membrane protein [Clostridium gasigenes]|uniref:Conserved hypothetical integral membrane protein n=2 Tax=Clostridium gasigenes TaxID=94869 RepID=A0A1H0MGT1_9CLOT|nr:conserved hypothetical integral membrane protein [Clostridium gasigenes]
MDGDYMQTKIQKIAPGLFICLIIGIISEILGNQFSTIGAATFAIFIGILAGNTIFHKKVFDLGTKFAEKNLLNYSIILMGANLNIMEIAALGLNGVTFIVIQMTLTILVAYFIGRKLGFNKKFSLLMASGNAVCGSSAIGATAPVIEADESDKVISITIVNVVGTILMVLLPLITSALYNNSVLESSAMMGGVLQSVGQVIGSAKFIGEDIVRMATVFKIIRIILLVAVVIIFSKIDVNEDVKSKNNNSSKNEKEVSVGIPWYITGFFIVSIIYTLGLVPGVLSSLFKWISGNFEIIALAGIGMRVKIKDLINEGPMAMLYGGIVAVCQIVFAIVLIKILI